MKVMQCWDDSVYNDIRLVELCRQYDAKATFNIIINGNEWTFEDFLVKRLSLTEMQEIYAGFKVAGHGGVPLTRMPVEDVKAELAEYKKVIEVSFKQQKCGYAYPGGGYDENVEKLVRNAGYCYARTTLNVAGKLSLKNPMSLPSHCHFLDENFWNKYEQVRKLNGVFYFWGHSYELKNDEKLWVYLESIYERVSADQASEWIDIVDLF